MLQKSIFKDKLSAIHTGESINKSSNYENY